ncbi:signal peptidase I [archaeon]|nr:signal peptidase I [archaeon]
MKDWNEMNWWEKTKKVYRYVFEENTILSWVASIILAYVIVKFVFYPLLSLFLGTGLPLVAVISPSMEHNGLDFDSWWEENKDWYEDRGILKEEFYDFSLRNGFNKGDVVVLKSTNKVGVGDIVVYVNEYSGMISSYPIIHRVTFINEADNSYEIKGDNNAIPDQWVVRDGELVGKAWFKVPYVGWLKIWFTQLITGGM